MIIHSREQVDGDSIGFLRKKSISVEGCQEGMLPLSDFNMLSFLAGVLRGT